MKFDVLKYQTSDFLCVLAPLREIKDYFFINRQVPQGQQKK
jgi:hypothetical protein